MGDGFAVDPSVGAFASPVAGTIILLAETLHAFAVRTPDGLDVLVHIGIDTVTLKGAGFTAKAATGDEVTAGQVIVEADLAALAGQVPSMITPVIITTKDAALGDLDTGAGAGRPVLTVTLPSQGA
jgi:glucose-specific phosphotransferase system IIA component